MTNQTYQPATTTATGTRAGATWLLPFYAILTSGVGLFFSQVVQFHLLPK